MSNNIIDKIQISGQSYDVKDSSAATVVELTQQEYDDLPSSAKTGNTLFVITDAQAGDLTNYYTKTETNTLLGGKQDTLVSSVNIKTINNTSLLGSGNIDIQGGGGSSYTAGTGIDITNNVISVTGMVDTTTYNTYTAATDTALSNKQTTLTAGTGISIVDNVISATGGGGGGKAIEAGRGITVTTGATADTVSFNLPISASSKSSGNYINIGVFYDFDSISATKFQNISIGSNNIAKSNTTIFHGNNNTSNGNGSFISGYHCQTNGLRSNAFGDYIVSNNEDELSTGRYNVSNKANSTFGNSGNTLFSVGNGTADNARHNAFEIRQNGDIYLSSGGTDIKLQDHLGGGGASYSAGTGIDITNNVISVSGVVETSAITTAITSSSTDAQVPSAKAVYDIVGDIETLLSQI